MGFQSHKGTMGHKVGSAIIGKDSGQPEMGGDEAGGNAMHGLQFSHLSVDPAANGLTVRHTPAPKGGLGGPGVKPESADLEQAHVFRDATEAHNHIGQLLGVRMASGLQKT